MNKSNDTDLFIPIISSSLLNAIYPRILITSPLQFNDQIFQRESIAVIQQWEALNKEFEQFYLQKQTKES